MCCNAINDHASVGLGYGMFDRQATEVGHEIDDRYQYVYNYFNKAEIKKTIKYKNKKIYIYKEKYNHTAASRVAQALELWH